MDGHGYAQPTEGTKGKISGERRRSASATENDPTNLEATSIWAQWTFSMGLIAFFSMTRQAMAYARWLFLGTHIGE